MAEKDLYLGVDIGGTVMSVALVDADGHMLALQRMDTPRAAGAQACLAELISAAVELVGHAPRRPSAVGVGFGGPVDPVAGVVRRSHHVAGWSGVALREEFERAVELPVVVENDANAGALAEALFGAGRGAARVLYINVGTGIGGGIVINGRVYRGAHFNAGEIGHVPVMSDGPECSCGKHGCLEALASGDAIGKRAEQFRALGNLEGSALAEVSALTGRVVGEYALKGDSAARTIVAEAGRYLGTGIAIAVNLLDPDIVVVGGGVAQLGGLYLRPARRVFRATAMDLVASTPIVAAELGYDAGVVGAAAVAMVALREGELR